MSPWHYSPLLSRSDLPADQADAVPLNRLLLAERRLVLLSRFSPGAVRSLALPTPGELWGRLRRWLAGGRA